MEVFSFNWRLESDSVEMSVIVRAHGMARIILGEGKMEVDLSTGTLGDLIDQLAAQHGEKVREELLDQNIGNLHHAYVFFVSGERAYDLSHKVQDGDEIVISGMVAGGSLTWGMAL